MTTYCTQDAWYAANKNNEQWYRDTYPFLVAFPPDYEDLKSFYKWDMENRNLTPLDSYLNCYDFVLSYFLENVQQVGKENRFTGQTFFGRLIKDQWLNESLLWYALKKTGSQIGTAIGWSLPVVVLVLFAFLWMRD